MLERVALAAGLVVFFIAGYFGVGHSVDPARAVELTTTLDDHIPFVSRSIWVYLWTIPAALIPIFVVRCPRLLRRTALAFAIVIVISLILFREFPVTSLQLRPSSSLLDVTRPSDWAVSILYAIDPPYNLFPSLHVSIAAVSAFSVWKAKKTYGVAMFIGVCLVAVSIGTVKQHFLLDAVGGLVLAALASVIILRPYHPGWGVTPSYSWRGPLLYLALLGLAYMSVYIAFLWST